MLALPWHASSYVSLRSYACMLFSSAGAPSGSHDGVSSPGWTELSEWPASPPDGRQGPADSIAAPKLPAERPANTLVRHIGGWLPALHLTARHYCTLQENNLHCLIYTGAPQA